MTTSESQMMREKDPNILRITDEGIEQYIDRIRKREMPYRCISLEGITFVAAADDEKEEEGEKEKEEKAKAKENEEKDEDGDDIKISFHSVPSERRNFVESDEEENGDGGNCNANQAGWKQRNDDRSLRLTIALTNFLKQKDQKQQWDTIRFRRCGGRVDLILQSMMTLIPENDISSSSSPLSMTCSTDHDDDNDDDDDGRPQKNNGKTLIFEYSPILDKVSFLFDHVEDSSVESDVERTYELYENYEGNDDSYHKWLHTLGTGLVAVVAAATKQRPSMLTPSSLSSPSPSPSSSDMFKFLHLSTLKFQKIQFSQQMATLFYNGLMESVGLDSMTATKHNINRNINSTQSTSTRRTRIMSTVKNVSFYKSTFLDGGDNNGSSREDDDDDDGLPRKGIILSSSLSSSSSLKQSHIIMAKGLSMLTSMECLDLSHCQLSDQVVGDMLVHLFDLVPYQANINSTTTTTRTPTPSPSLSATTEPESISSGNKTLNNVNKVENEGSDDIVNDNIPDKVLTTSTSKNDSTKVLDGTPAATTTPVNEQQYHLMKEETFSSSFSLSSLKELNLQHNECYSQTTNALALYFRRQLQQQQQQLRRQEQRQKMDQMERKSDEKTTTTIHNDILQKKKKNNDTSCCTGLERINLSNQDHEYLRFGGFVKQLSKLSTMTTSTKSSSTSSSSLPPSSPSPSASSMVESVSCSLKCLDLSANDISRAELSNLARMVSLCPLPAPSSTTYGGMMMRSNMYSPSFGTSLRELNLSGCDLSLHSGGLKMLSLSLASSSFSSTSSSSLMELSMSNCRITSKGLAAFSTYVPRMVRLRVLRLGGDQLFNHSDVATAFVPKLMNMAMTDSDVIALACKDSIQSPATRRENSKKKKKRRDVIFRFASIPSVGLEKVTIPRSYVVGGCYIAERVQYCCDITRSGRAFLCHRLVLLHRSLQAQQQHVHKEEKENRTTMLQPKGQNEKSQEQQAKERIGSESTGLTASTDSIGTNNQIHQINRIYSKDIDHHSSSDNDKAHPVSLWPLIIGRLNHTMTFPEVDYFLYRMQDCERRRRQLRSSRFGYGRRASCYSGYLDAGDNDPFETQRRVSILYYLLLHGGMADIYENMTYHTSHPPVNMDDTHSEYDHDDDDDTDDGPVVPPMRRKKKRRYNRRVIFSSDSSSAGGDNDGLYDDMASSSSSSSSSSGSVPQPKKKKTKPLRLKISLKGIQKGSK